MNFEKICKVFLMEEPFYGIVLSSFNKEEDKRVGTLGICPDGDSFKLIINPEWLNQFSDNTVLELLKHEMIHVCFNHPFMGHETGFDEENHELFNIACDLECNSYLNRARMDKAVGGMWAEDFGYQKGLGELNYWKLLKQTDLPEQLKQKIQYGISLSKEGNSSGSGNGTGESNDNSNSLTIDSHALWPKLTKAQAERAQHMMEQIVLSAADSVEKSHGTESLPEAMRIRIEKLRKKAKPVADWRRYCRRYMGNEYSYLTKKSRRRESKRFAGMMGNRHMRTSKILVAIDTSGSVSMSEYMEFMQQVMTMKNVVSFDIVECDTEIRHRYSFKGKVNTELHGGGGTSFQPPVDLYYKDGNYDALIYFTDGECPIPNNTPKDTLWVVSSKGQRNNEYRKNGAKVIFIPKKEQ